MSIDSCNEEKRDKPTIVELRNGKLVLKQKLLSFEKMSETMQGAYLIPGTRSSRGESEPPLHRDRQVQGDVGGEIGVETTTLDCHSRRAQASHCKTGPRKVPVNPASVPVSPCVSQRYLAKKLCKRCPNIYSRSYCPPWTKTRKKTMLSPPFYL